MKALINFHFWYAAIWSVTILFYGFRWSSLNAPLVPELQTFFLVTISVSIILGFIRATFSRDVHIRSPEVGYGSDSRSTIRSSWIVISLLITGFIADFTYQRKIPLLSGDYEGFDVTKTVQDTVGIPIIHVFIISFSIFYSLILADRFARTLKSIYIYQFLVIFCLLILNNSRGYATFTLVGTLIIILSWRSSLKRPNYVRVTIFAAIIGYLIITGIGAFGNVRSGVDWNDSSYISSIGLYQENYPSYMGGEFKWFYTYLTSPLGNLNYNVQYFTTGGSLNQSLLAFVPDTVSKYAIANAADIEYQVTYLNASTGFAVPFSLGGGITALYLNFAVQVILLEGGALVVSRLGGAEILYGTCASIMVITFVFFNSFTNSATCFLIYFALSAALIRRHRRLTSSTSNHLSLTPIPS